jgi:aspartate-semialdehyde dehydrogenase
MLDLLAERNTPMRELRAFASARSAGATVRSGDRSVVVEDLEAADPAGLDVALFSAGADRSRKHAQRFVDAGCIVIDNSSAFRMDAEVPLVVPGVNEDAVGGRAGVIANPNCSTIQLVLALAPIHRAVGLTHVHVTTYQSVSGTGRAALEELDAQQAALVAGREPEWSTYPHRIAANVLPHCDSFDADGNTGEELKLMRETRKILALSDLPVSATCVRVPVHIGHSEAVHIQTRDAISPDAVRELLSDAYGVRVVDDPAANSYPMPIDAAGTDDVLVGRIRTDASRPNGLALFVVADNLRVGAATNSIRILDQVVRERQPTA